MISKYLIALLSISLFSVKAYAVGGDNVELLTEEEVTSKGILKLSNASQSFIGTGVLFDGGMGQIGITAKHVISEMNEKCHYAQCGAEKRKILRVFNNKDNDIAIFVVESRFSNIKNLPKIKEQFQPTEPHLATLYGYGDTDDNLVPIGKPGNICRKTDVSFATLTRFTGDFRAFFTEYIEKQNFDNMLVSSKCCCPIPLLQDFDEEVETLKLLDKETVIPQAAFQPSLTMMKIVTLSHAIALKSQGLPFSNQSGEVLPLSSGYGMPGDSGGPLIDKENNLCGLFFQNFVTLSQYKMHVCFSAPEQSHTCASFADLQFAFEGMPLDVTIYRDKHKGIFFLIKNGHKTKWLDYYNLFYKDLHQFIAYGQSNFYNCIYTEEMKLPIESRWFINLLPKMRPMNSNYFVSINNLKEWIGRATSVANKFIETINPKSAEMNPVITSPASPPSDRQ
jgi:hypothetical protein